jgi:hypothetical protein
MSRSIEAIWPVSNLEGPLKGKRQKFRAFAFGQSTFTIALTDVD